MTSDEEPIFAANEVSKSPGVEKNDSPLEEDCSGTEGQADVQAARRIRVRPPVKFCGIPSEMSKNRIPTTREVYLHFRLTVAEMRESGKKFETRSRTL